MADIPKRQLRPPADRAGRRVAVVSNDDLTPPESSASDTARSLVKAGISGAPVIGGPAAELFELVVPSSLDRRRQDWFDRVAAKLRELEDRDVDLSALAEDEGFITVLI